MGLPNTEWQQGFEPGLGIKVMRFVSKLILAMLRINGKSRWSNEFTQATNPWITVHIPGFENLTKKPKLWFRTGHGRLFWRAKETPSLSPLTNKWISLFSNSDVFYDIGANIGLFTLMAAKFVNAKVIAVEIDLMNARILYENIYMNNCQGNVTILPLGLDSTTHQETLFLKSMSYGDALHNLREVSPHIRKPEEIKFNVAVFSLDDLILALRLPAPTKLKIDVDGAELEILRGALRSLKSVSAIIVEYKLGSKEREDIHQFLKNCSFDFDFDSDEEHSGGCVDGFFSRENSNSQMLTS
jgi:FkbM family methyltransferase